MAGQAHGDDGHAAHLGIKLFEVLHGFLQRRAVVEAGAADDLAVHDDAGCRQILHPGVTSPAPGVAQEPRPQRRVRGVDRDVDGAHMELRDAPQLPLREVGECDVVPGKEAQPGVIILEIQRLPHPGGKLVHKAEQAAVAAGAGLVHEIGGKAEAQILPFRLFHPAAHPLPVRLFPDDLHHGVVSIIFIVQHIPHVVAVEGQELVPRLAQAQERAGRVHAPDHRIHGASPPFHRSLQNSKKRRSSAAAFYFSSAFTLRTCRPL